jgi:hypothetical protein
VAAGVEMIFGENGEVPETEYSNIQITTCCIYNRPVQKCGLSDPRKALVYGRFLGILFTLSFYHREFFLFK